MTIATEDERKQRWIPARVGDARVGDAGPARVEPTAAGPKVDPPSESTFGERRRRAVAWATARGGRLASCKPYTDRPPSVADVVAYVKAGGFVPGDHPRWIELPGYAYGALVAVPVTVAGYSLMWVVQRPSRLALVLFVLGLLWLAWNG